SAGAVALQILRPADQTVIGGDLQEGEIAPARVAMQVLDRGDTHVRSSQFLARDARAIPSHLQGRPRMRLLVRLLLALSLLAVPGAAVARTILAAAPISRMDLP